MRIGILCHPQGITCWQREALDLIAPTHDLFVLSCPQAPPSCRKLRHSAYYALNLAAVRNRMTRPKPFPTDDYQIAGSFSFQPQFEGLWAKLPEDLLRWIRKQRIDLIVKFGLGLMRVPAPDRLPVPILSYHHGDPRRFRGRPAGFYELLQGERFMGQVVQVLSNKLDQGEVLVFAESRIVPHSYRLTLVEAFRLSPYLLPQAIKAFGEGRRLPIEPNGRNYRLPSNSTVTRFMLQRQRALAGRLAYGGFVEKKWEVSTLDVSEYDHPIKAVSEAGRLPQRWQTLSRLPGYSFYADPFFAPGGDLVVEGMNPGTGKGELVEVGIARHQPVGGFGGHVSYPAPVEEGSEHYLLPETSGWCRPTVFSLSDGTARPVAQLDIDAPALLDPTIYREGDRLYLFANLPAEGASVLRLWSAPSLFGRFEEHPQSPVRVSVRGSRMAGQLVRTGSALFRLGQDFRDQYGDGVLAFRVTELTERSYREEPSGEAAFDTVRGPHTVNFRGRLMVFDWYEQRVSPLAGLRRLLNRF